jgi:iron complex transport system ATP-binding protein
VIAPARVAERSPLLVVDGVTVAYRFAGRELIALRDVSLKLQAGEVVGLVGPNGSGKTTLIRAVTGVVRRAAGRVLVDSVDITRLRQREMARLIAVVPQNPVLPPAFNALSCVLMGRTPHLRLLQNEGASDLNAARRAMLATDTWRLADRLLGELSGGERQRVVVARALAQETAILLLDEPTAHLDLGHQAGVLDLMRDCARDDGKAVLAVVHDLTLAARYCDRLVMLRAGSVVASGAPEDVLTTQILRDVYGVAVDVFPHPVSGRPVVAAGGEG